MTRSRLAAVSGVLLVLVLAVGAWLTIGPGAAPQLEPWSSLDTRWGTYVSERQWGTPHEAVNDDGWGLDYLSAVRLEYRYGEDGIAGLTDRDGTFNIGWAIWDGRQARVAERLFGWSNPGGEHGEAIVDRRVFGANTPTSSYASYVLTYPNSGPRYEITLEQARADDRSGVLRASARNTGEQAAGLDLLVKGWFHQTDRLVELEGDALLLHGPDSVVAVTAREVDAGQVAAAKGALDRNLRSGGLTGGGPGHIGALHRHLELAPGATATWTLAWAEAGAAGPAQDRARQVLDQATDVMEMRRGEADELFRGSVTRHEDLYRQALMSLLWSQSLYTWDGGGYDPQWAGRVAADDVLILPDKWEFPWLASWDSAFHAVTAALVDPQLGAEQLRFLLSERWQQPDGHVPCAEWVMNDECPPVFAWAAWRVYQAGAGEGFLADVFPGLQRQYAYWWNELAVEPDGLFTGGFLGMDNLPRAPGRAQADASGWMAFFASHMARIAAELGEPDLEREFAADLAHIADTVNTELWDERSGMYYDQGEAPGALLRTPSYSGLIPFIAGIVPPDRQARVLEALRDETRFLSPHGIRSVSRESLLYEPGLAAARGVNSNWRGPIWLPINYLLIQALGEADPELAETLRQRVIDAVEADWRATGRLHEYFDAETGEGLGADAQAGWTALVANLIIEGWPAD